MKTFTVIDTIEIGDAQFRHHPEWQHKFGSSGLIAVLDPDEATDPPFVSGAGVIIRRPDGSTIRRVATVAERPSTAFGLFFPALVHGDIPRLSCVEPDEAQQAEHVVGGNGG